MHSFFRCCFEVLPKFDSEFVHLDVKL
jgi:hypothetical protein